MEIKYDKTKIISKYDFDFIIEKKNNKNQEEDEYFSHYALFMENYSNHKLIITLYEITEELILIKYCNILSLNYFINQSPYIKCLSLMSKNPFTISNIFELLKSRLESEKERNKDFIFSKKYMNIKISKICKEKKESIFLIFNIILSNLEKEKIKIELHKDKVIVNEDKNDENGDLLNELLEQNQNMIVDIKNLEIDLKILTDSKNGFINTLQKCDTYYGQSIEMKMDFMDMGIDSDIFQSKEDYNFIAENISKRVNKKIEKIRQVFKASSNGDNINAFQDSCMYVQNIMVLILSDEKKCFGGFTQAEWDNNNRYKCDENAFLFSVNNREIYPILNRYKRMAINCNDDYYISVFGNDIYICDCFFSNNGNITQEGYYDYSNSKIKGDYKLTGKKYFSVSELEVYEFIFLE
jgi:hypothetical protein